VYEGNDRLLTPYQTLFSVSCFCNVFLENRATQHCTSFHPVDAKYLKQITKINQFDVSTLRKTLDDNVVSALQEREDIELDLSLSNLRLILGVASVLVAIWSHFGTGDMPDSRPLLLIAVIIYYAISLCLTCLSSFVEHDTLCVIYTSGQLIRLRSKLVDGDRTYHVTADIVGVVLKKPTKSPLNVFKLRESIKLYRAPPISKNATLVLEKAIDRYFDVRGYLYTPHVQEDVFGLVQELQNRFGKAR